MPSTLPTNTLPINTLPTSSLPSMPSLEQLRKQARELQRAVRSGRPEATALVDARVPGVPADHDFPLRLAQLALARQYGFRSWPRLVEQVAVINSYTRTPVTGEMLNPPTTPADRLDAFLRNAVLTYGEDDGPHRWRTARELLAAAPELTTASVHAAAAAADYRAMARLLAAHPGLAQVEGGPLRWEPLLYLTFSRLDPAVPVGDVLTTAGLLLQHGADPNAGYLWFGLTTPFTALTGVFGHGEQGVERQPAHPHQYPLARLLLEAGADANDGQALYNRMFESDHAHLAVLFDYGLGRGDGGPWHRRLPESTDAPTDLVRAQLAWAITHGLAERVALLAAHGVDLSSPLDSGHLPLTTDRTPLQLAALSGQADIGRLLRSLGAAGTGAGPADDPATSLIAALLDARAVAVAELAARHPDLLAQVRRRSPSLVLRAVVIDRGDAVELLVANGFDVNALGRSDIVAEQPWESPLHHAAGQGRTELVRLLLTLGADPAARDRRFQATPLDWARHFEQRDVIDLLQPVS